MPDLPSLDATAQLAELAARRISARELLEASVARHRAVHARVNAVTATDLERARREADALDQARARGDRLGPLAGLPMTVKDCLDVAFMPAVAGHPGLLGRNPKDVEDAAAVARVRKAGAVVWGKTNVPFMAGDFQTYNSIYGTTNNPYDLKRTPGGSSGGAAAALACGIAPLEIGSDIGGSIRIPAHFCGVFGLKPTYGAVPQRGHVPPSPLRPYEIDLNVIGPLARSARDLKLLFEILSGRQAQGEFAVRGKRIAVWHEEPEFPLSATCKRAVETAAGALEEAGATVAPIRPPFVAGRLVDAYLDLLLPIVGAELPQKRLRSLERQRPFAALMQKFGCAPRFSRAHTVLRLTSRYREWAAASAARDRVKAAMKRFFGEWDAILMPVTPTSAFAHDHSQPINRRTIAVDGKPANYMTNGYWIALAAACHLPAAVAPVLRTASGMPVGVQIVGPWGSDYAMIALAAALEERLGGFTPPPESWITGAGPNP